MGFEIDGLEFDIDLDQTMLCRAKEAEDPCDCAYCRNFAASVDGRYPNLRPFLAQFGIDICYPDESMPFDMPGEMWYENQYSVCGNILTGDQATLVVDGVEVHFHRENLLHINPVCPEPCFFVGVGMMRLPWVLDEPMGEVRSPGQRCNLFAENAQLAAGQALHNRSYIINKALPNLGGLIVCNLG